MCFAVAKQAAAATFPHVSSTLTLEDVPERLRAKFAELSPEALESALASLARVRERQQQERELQKIVVPDPPAVDEREMVTAHLHGEVHSSQGLSAAQLFEVDSQLGHPRRDRTLHPDAYNQPVRMLTLSEAAETIGVSTSTAWRMTRNRGLPSVRFFKTVRVRSDHAWAVRNRRAAGYPLGDGRDLLAPQRGATDRGVPIDEVAATLRVHPHTLWRWWRFYAAAAAPGQPITSLHWRCAGRRESAVIPEDLLATWQVPYNKSSLRPIRLTDVIKVPAPARVKVDRVTRNNQQVAPDQVRRTDRVRDAISHQWLYTLPEASEQLGMTVSGASKAIARAGIATMRLGGVLRVRQDDVTHLALRRAAKADRQQRPWSRPVADPDPDMVPLSDAAERIGVTVRTLRRRAAAGKISLVTSGGELLMRRHEVQAAAHREQSRKASAGAPRPGSSRGATLTDTHIENFTQWVAWRYPDINISAGLHTRASAAEIAGCRPSVIEELVVQGLIPAKRDGRDLQIRLVDLVASGVFSAKVARMCPKLQVSDITERRNIESEYLTFDEASRHVDRTTAEVRYLVAVGTLKSVRFGKGTHRIHVSEVTGPAIARLRDNARPYRPLNRVRPLGWGYTVNDAAHHLGVSERTVQRMIRKGALLATEATRDKWCRTDSGVMLKMPVPVNNGGLLLSERSVRSARRLRQVRDELPRDDVPVTPQQLRDGTAQPLQPWQRYRLFDEDGHPIDQYGQRLY